jgi:hemin uptake protein HemP
VLLPRLAAVEDFSCPRLLRRIREVKSQDLRKPGTKVLSENSVKYWTALGGPRRIRELRRETGVAATLCRTRGVVEAKDLVTGDKAVVLRNAGSRYQVEVEDFTTGNTLPTFSLIFTEFESEGFLFHTTWQWEVGTWWEHASSVWDMLTLEMLDWEVPSTIYAKERKGTHEAWRFFE